MPTPRSKCLDGMSHHVVGRYRRPNKTPAFFLRILNPSFWMRDRMNVPNREFNTSYTISECLCLVPQFRLRWSLYSMLVIPLFSVYCMLLTKQTSHFTHSRTYVLNINLLYCMLSKKMVSKYSTCR
jgi:hypothetical protein